MRKDSKRSSLYFLVALLAFCIPLSSFGAKSSVVKCQLILSLSHETSNLLKQASAKLNVQPEQMHELYFQSLGYTSQRGWMELNNSAAAIIATTAAISKKSPSELLKIFAGKLRVETTTGFYAIPETMAATLTAYQVIKKLSVEEQFDTFKDLSAGDTFSLKPFLELLNSIKN